MLEYYYYNKLSFVEKKLYDSLKSAIIRKEPTYKADFGVGQEKLKQMLSKVVFDNPSFVHFSDLFILPISGREISLNHLNIDNSLYISKLDDLVDEIEKNLPENASDYTVCKLIYDRLASTVTYDEEAKGEYFAVKKLEHENSAEFKDRALDFYEKYGESFTPYGVLINSKGTCHGIAGLYKILCEKFGVQCTCALAKSNDSNETPHVLNVVEIEGKRAFVDLVGGLKSTISGLDLVRYDSFLMPYRIYGKKYVVEEKFSCNDEGLNYYSQNGLWFDSLNKMRKYLGFCTFASTKGEIRCYYNGGRMSDSTLESFLDDILSSRCERGYRIKGYYVKDGFCAAQMTNDRED